MDGPASYAIDFGQVVADLSANFVGRDWLDREIDEFLGQREKQRLVITGEPGIGKSAFVAHLVRDRGYIHHFIRSHHTGGSLTWSDPHLFCLSLGAQLGLRYPDQRGHLNENLRFRVDNEGDKCGISLKNPQIIKYNVNLLQIKKGYLEI